jgi:hypothetical protein
MPANEFRTIMDTRHASKSTLKILADVEYIEYFTSRTKPEISGFSDIIY